MEIYDKTFIVRSESECGVGRVVECYVYIITEQTIHSQKAT